MTFSRAGNLSESRAADGVRILRSKHRALSPGTVAADVRRRKKLAIRQIRLLTSAATKGALQGEESVSLFK